LKGASIAAALLTVALAAYDLTSAARTRCVLAGHNQTVLALDELDVLPVPAGYRLSAPADWNGARPLHLVAGSPLVLRGRAGDPAGGRRAAAVFASIDGRLIRAGYAAPAFRVVVPARLLPPGTHRLSLDIVASDLSGFAEPIARRPVEVRHVWAPVARGKTSE